MHEHNTEVLRQINQSYMYVYIDTTHKEIS